MVPIVAKIIGLAGQGLLTASLSRLMLYWDISTQFWHICYFVMSSLGYVLELWLLVEKELLLNKAIL